MVRQVLNIYPFARKKSDIHIFKVINLAYNLLDYFA